VGPWHVVAVVENIPFGADHRLRKQAEAMVAQGWRVTIVGPRSTVNEPYRARGSRLRLVEYPAPPELGGPQGHVVEYAWSAAWAFVRLAGLRLRGRIDVVQLCQPPDIYFPLVGLLRWLGSRVVVDQRDLMPELLAARYPRAPRRAIDVLHWFERRTQRAVDHTITVNEHLRRRLEDAGGKGRVSVVGNGPVLARVDAVPLIRTGDGDGEETLVVWVGKMGVQDRLDLVVDTAEAVVRTHELTSVRFELIGDGECLDDLRATVRARGLHPWVIFTGWVAEPSVFEHLARADLGVDTSLQEEVTPVKALEYMAFGLPFVAFDLPETARLADGAAVLVPPGDVGALAAALVALSADEPARRALGRAGRRRVEESLAWERQQASYLDAVGPVAPGPGVSPGGRPGAGPTPAPRPPR
jgi:glycosyltransferase involved in cell wall biosynthesis